MVAVRVLKGGKLVPRVTALMKMKKDNMKIINDARPNKLISFLEARWPTIAAKNARPVKTRAAKKSDSKLVLSGFHRRNRGKETIPYGTGNRRRR
jgi:hypothetical protein